VLLHGTPGTGKTMLAHALAGECNVAFLVESATNFVTKFVGSGPENVRILFAKGYVNNLNKYRTNTTGFA
jgi:cell division protease FtsH